ncbi:MAG: hypothetical protein EG822_17540 [Deltaproteobacteria bacterium]|nr:hypothetical protein [Deltaproteobacteria bacterium]TLN03310.1 MAG: hypothetical protein FDZ73_08450 [bacterium]
MSRTATGTIYRAYLLVVMITLAAIAAGCTPRLHAPLQPDGWSAQPIGIECRFTPAANLDPATKTPVGDEGYYLYILNEHANWDYSSAASLVFTIWLRPRAHSWLILENPKERLEFGHTGDLGITNPRYHEGVFQKIKEGHPDPIGYLWNTMTDGQFQIGKPNRPPKFVWRMPITRRHYQVILEYLMQRKYDQFDLRNNNCTNFVAEAAALAGINLIHRIHLTLPPETKVLGRKRRIWTDPHFRILEYSTPEVLDADLRQLARLGIGSDVTEWYLALAW